MTKLDRDLAIADNLEYVRRALESIGHRNVVVFAGFSQGVAMAYRAAAAMPCAGLIALAGDVPPDVRDRAAALPPVLLGRGIADEWYSEEKMRGDLAILKEATPVTFDGGHEWTDEFRTAAGIFLSRLSAV